VAICNYWNGIARLARMLSVYLVIPTHNRVYWSLNVSCINLSLNGVATILGKKIKEFLRTFMFWHIVFTTKLKSPSKFNDFYQIPKLLFQNFIWFQKLQGLYKNGNNRGLSKTCGHRANTFQCHYQTLALWNQCQWNDWNQTSTLLVFVT